MISPPGSGLLGWVWCALSRTCSTRLPLRKILRVMPTDGHPAAAAAVGPLAVKARAWSAAPAAPFWGPFKGAFCCGSASSGVSGPAMTAGRNSSMAIARMMVATSYLYCPTGGSASCCSRFLSNSHTCLWTLQAWQRDSLMGQAPTTTGFKCDVAIGNQPSTLSLVGQAAFPLALHPPPLTWRAAP